MRGWNGLSNISKESFKDVGSNPQIPFFGLEMGSARQEWSVGFTLSILVLFDTQRNGF